MVINGIISEKNVRNRNNKICNDFSYRSDSWNIYSKSNRKKTMKIDHQIIITFEKGEKCFCCNVKFDQDTTITKSFKSIKEAMAFQKVINRTKELKTRYQQLIGKK